MGLKGEPALKVKYHVHTITVETYGMIKDKGHSPGGAAGGWGGAALDGGGPVGAGGTEGGCGGPVGGLCSIGNVVRVRDG